MTKAIDYASELLAEQGPILHPQDQGTLKFSLATCYTLDGNPAQLDSAIALYNESLQECQKEKAGFILNNLAMTHFHQFVGHTNTIGADVSGVEADLIKKTVEHFEECLHLLRRSVHEFE